MENRFQPIDDIIARVLSGEASEKDNALLDEWLRLSAENVSTWKSSVKIFRESKAMKDLITVDTDKAWLKVKSKLKESKNTPAIISINAGNTRNIWYRIAAILVLAVGIGTAVYFLNRNTTQLPDRVISSAESVLQDIFPDGSTIIVNKNSIVSYSAAGFSKKRTVHLTGEAFFYVIHDENNTFIVEAGDLKITDVGTSFNVKAFPDSKIIIVTVETGEVSLITSDRKGFHVVAGETAEYNTETRTMVKNMSDPNNSAYKDRIFIFDNTELAVIVKVLSDVYGIKITIQNEVLNKCKLTASFNNETLDTILDVIAETLQLKVTKAESEIQLNGNACN